MKLISHSSWTGVEYFITGGDVHGRFTVDAATGSLKTIRPLDREGWAGYHIHLAAWKSPYYTTTTVRITVDDENDHGPVIGTFLAAQSVDIPRQWPLGQPIVFVEAQDADDGVNGQLTFSLLTSGETDDVGADKRALFAVNRTTGSVYLVHPLGPDTETVKLVVRVTDGGNLSATQTVRLRVVSVRRDTLESHKIVFQVSFKNQFTIFRKYLNGTE